MKVLFFHKNGSARGGKLPQIRGARGVPFMENTPRDMDKLAKNAGCLILYSIAYPELIASIQFNFLAITIW